MNIQQNAAAYNNVGHILKTAAQPLSSRAILNDPRIAELGVEDHVVRDALAWYHKHRFIKKLPKQWTVQDTSRFQWEWSEAATAREVPDHTQRVGVKRTLSKEGRDAIARAARRRWKKLKAEAATNGSGTPRNLGAVTLLPNGKVTGAPGVAARMARVDNATPLVFGGGEEKYAKIGSAFHALSGVKLTNRQVQALLEVAVLVERGI